MKKIILMLFSAAASLLALGVSQAGEVNGLAEFRGGTPALASEVNANFSAVAAAVNDNDARITQTITAVQNGLADILNNQYVPFKVQTNGGVCNTAAQGSANPQIIIDGDGVDGTFVVSSILVKTDDIPATGFVALSVNRVTVDGTAFDTRTANLTGNAGGTGVLESFDLMGTPVRLTGDLNDHTPGANFPHQIVADSNGGNDIAIQLFCRTDVDDLNILVVTVSGWKRVGETISVTYIPGL